MRVVAYCRLALVMSLSGIAGCQTVAPDFSKWGSWTLTEPKVEVSEFKTPNRVAAIWTPDILRRPGVPTMRGFGGRFFFYDERNQAIPVEGQLVVYAYDDTKTDTSRQLPTKKFVFTPDQFTQYLGESELGPSYSIWIPWDQVGGYQQSVSLLPVFTSSAGQVVMGHQAANVLPGLAPPKKEEAYSSGSRTGSTGKFAQTSGMQRPSDGPDSTQAVHLADEPQTQMRTTTINVTPSLRNRMISAAYQQTAVPPAMSARPLPASAPLSSPVSTPISLPAPSVPEVQDNATAEASQAGRERDNRRPMNYIDRPRFPEPRPRSW